ncbi:hypothetical protein RF11_12679 [Thelohanellus kitauei]|uniref:Uncharacterized protein n=1 Tax=Thelohanellus kitauei TaxID=669202 RepID=A0A0C2NES2_THEKT|nr:hypothetical protein RF11_12679 [Thelohanellus kitauei]
MFVQLYWYGRPLENPGDVEKCLLYGDHTSFLLTTSMEVYNLSPVHYYTNCTSTPTATFFRQHFCGNNAYKSFNSYIRHLNQKYAMPFCSCDSSHNLNTAKCGI